MRASFTTFVDRRAQAINARKLACLIQPHLACAIIELNDGLSRLRLPLREWMKQWE